MRHWKDITVAVVGNKGNMGKRYQAILNHLGIKNFGWDKGEWPDKVDATHAIVATPTWSHVSDCIKLWPDITNVLCEKPIDTSMTKLEHLEHEAHGMDIRMVCNWKFVNPKIYKNNNIYYNHYNTGKDGFYWDCIQLIHLAGNGECILRRTAPAMDCVINERKVTLQDIAESYIWMVTHWLIDASKLWSMEDAKQANIKTIERMRLEGEL